MAIRKSVGENFSAKVTFKHKGKGGIGHIALGFAPGKAVGHHPVQYWVEEDVELASHADWTTCTVEVSGTIPPGLKDRQDICKKVVFEGVTLLEDWDDDVYFILLPQESLLSEIKATYT